MRVLPVATGAVQAVKQSFVMASTFQSACKANTSATPVGLGTAGIILVTPEPSPGFPQLRVPVASVGPACTVTSIEAFPTVIVALPGPTAVRVGGSSEETVATAGLLDVHVNPVTAWPFAVRAWVGCVPFGTIVTTYG